MSKAQQFSLTEALQHLTEQSNNQVWDLLDKENRSGQEEEMLLAANASLYLWKQVGTAVHAQRGSWLLSRVHTVQGQSIDALKWAQKCREITDNNPDEMEDFDLAFAQEALARAYALAGDLGLANKHRVQAAELGEQIQDPEDQQIFLSDFQGGNWFQLD
ncbi:MAG: hypothetical protein E4H33_03675 [Anaerolineales bacterium]|nr:MAG: hypothetical protein E4H33_03675 [Anaerolineales bacterium]